LQMLLSLHVLHRKGSLKKCYHFYLKGEPERAKEYLQVAYDLGGDTKYKTFAKEQLLNIGEIR